MSIKCHHTVITDYIQNISVEKGISYTMRLKFCFKNIFVCCLAHFINLPFFIIERCSQNNLSSSDAEGNIDTVRRDWSINSNDDTAVVIAEPSERYFALTPNSTKRFPRIQQNITISEGEYNLYFRCVNDM